jgi:hypothetical protein
LWKAYNERLVALHRRRPFPLLRFDAAREQLLARVTAVARSWGLPGVAAGGSFFDAELVHEAAGDERVPMPCRRVWKYLVEHTTDI